MKYSSGHPETPARAKGMDGLMNWMARPTVNDNKTKSIVMHIHICKYGKQSLQEGAN
jgi:hypothetical protein